MKQENFEKPDTLLRQLGNCQDQLAHMPDVEPKWLNIDVLVSDCGTYRCWLGDHYHRKGLGAKFGRLSRYIHSLRRHVQFAFGEDIYESVFTDTHPLTTAERKASLQVHIKNMEQKITAWYSEREVLGVMA